MRWMCLFMLRCLGSYPTVAQDRDYGRSMIVTDRGIVATSQVLASQAGAQILDQGGSAIDAAIAAKAVLGVTEPMSRHRFGLSRACGPRVTSSRSINAENTECFVVNP
jgi:hypothetical protein